MMIVSFESQKVGFLILLPFSASFGIFANGKSVLLKETVQGSDAWLDDGL